MAKKDFSDLGKLGQKGGVDSVLGENYQETYSSVQEFRNVAHGASLQLQTERKKNKARTDLQQISVFIEKQLSEKIKMIAWWERIDNRQVIIEALEDRVRKFEAENSDHEIIHKKWLD